MANHAWPWLWSSSCPRLPPATASNNLQLRQVQRIVAGIVAYDSALPKPSNYVKAQNSIEAWPKEAQAVLRGINYAAAPSPKLRLSLPLRQSPKLLLLLELLKNLLTLTGY